MVNHGNASRSTSRHPDSRTPGQGHRSRRRNPWPRHLDHRRPHSTSRTRRPQPPDADPHLFPPRETLRVLPGIDWSDDTPGFTNYLGGLEAAISASTDEYGVKHRTFLDAGENPPRGAIITYYLAGSTGRVRSAWRSRTLTAKNPLVHQSIVRRRKSRRKRSASQPTLAGIASSGISAMLPPARSTDPILPAK